MTPVAEFAGECRRLSRLIDDAVEELARQTRQTAGAEREYRLGKALMWINSTESSASAKEPVVNGESADLRYARDLAAGLRRSAVESLRARMAQLNALQTMANLERAEAELLRTAPEMAP